MAFLLLIIVITASIIGTSYGPALGWATFLALIVLSQNPDAKNK